MFVSTRIWQHPLFRSLSLAAKATYVMSTWHVAAERTGSALLDPAECEILTESGDFEAAARELVSVGLFVPTERGFAIRNLCGEPIGVTADPDTDDPDETAGVWFERKDGAGWP